MCEENKSNCIAMIDGVEINNISELTFDINSIDDDFYKIDYSDKLKNFIRSMIDTVEYTMTGWYDCYTLSKTTRKVFHLWKCGKSKRIKKKNQKRYFNIAI